MIRLIGIVILTFMPAWVAFCQSIVNPPAFEVATVKPNMSSDDPKKQKARFLPGHRIELPNRTLKSFIMSAYDVQSDMITGGPKWLDSDRFDIVANAPPEADENMLRTMLQTLLAERFKLATHRENKVTPEFALVVGKSGPRLERSLQPGQPDCSWKGANSDGLHDARGGAETAGARRADSLRHRVCHNMTMAELAKALPGWGGIGIDRPVVDLTGLDGAYDFELEIAAGRPKKGGVAGEDDSGPTIFDAMTHLGLKLESRKRSMPIVVIDHVERVPTEN